MIQYLIPIFICITLVWGGKCPKSDVIEPCHCYEKGDPWGNRIQCGGLKFDLKNVFTKLSEALNTTNREDKHFEKFWFHNYAIEVIPEAVFGDITFDEISFYQAQNLTKIHSYALGPSSLTVKEFNLWRKLPSLVNDPPDYDLFKMMSLMVNVQQIAAFGLFRYQICEKNKCEDHTGGNVTVIPEYAFKPLNGEQNNLTKLILRDSYGEGTIKTISNYSFYHLNNLKSIDLGHSKIDHIPAHAFDFKKSFNETLDLNLSNNQLNSSSFEIGAFLNAKRPMHIHFSYNSIKFLDEAIFGPFFSLNSNNTIDLQWNFLTCGDCRNFWLIRDNSKLKNRIIGNIECRKNEFSNSKPFWMKKTSLIVK